jgi:hypothetical protein
MNSRQIPGFFIGVLVVLGTQGCEEDIRPPVADGPYPVVHCVLDMNDTAHYVRLTKTFSGPVDAGIMAQNPDSLYFDDVRVYLEWWDHTYVFKTLELQPTYEKPKDPGLFFSDSSLLYKYAGRLTGAVRLRIEIPEIHTDVLGYINILGQPTFTAPDPAMARILHFFESEPVRIIWSGVPTVCETTIRLRYLEVTQSGIDTCHLDWVRKGADLVIVTSDYLQFLAYWIRPREEVRYRVVQGIDLLVATGDAGLANYLKYRDWGIDIVEKPFSNLVNAYGFVGSRVRGGLTGFVPNEKFMDTLANCSVTRHLGFVKWIGGTAADFVPL